MTNTLAPFIAVPAWLNVDALTTREEIAERRALAVRGRELLPALADWIAAAAPLAQWPDVELEGPAADLILTAMGIEPLDEIRHLLADLARVFDLPPNDIAQRIAELENEHPELLA